MPTRDQFDADADGDEMADAREPWRPNYNVLDNPEAFGYKVFSRAHDEEIAAESLSTPDELERLQQPSSTRSCATCRARWRASPTGCSAS